LRDGVVAAAMLELPDTIAVFPLTGVLLLPRARLPLNIFEPRYVAMIDDALASPGRMIGMIQPLEPERTGFIPPLHGVGCLGRIAGFAESDDPRYRYLITLSGVCRFSLRGENETMRGYRRFAIDTAPWRGDLAPEGESDIGIARDQLLAALRGYFKTQNIDADWEAIKQSPEDRLVTTLAMACPFAPNEKQALLEAKDMRARADTLLALLRMAAIGDGDRAKH
jgi:Lon protease-like protein